MNQVAENVYVETDGPGANAGFIVIREGAIAIDAPLLSGMVRAWRDQIVQTAGGPIQYVILTDSHPDRLLGVCQMGAPIIAGWGAYERVFSLGEAAWRGTVDVWGRIYPEAGPELQAVNMVLPQLICRDRLQLHKADFPILLQAVEGGTPGALMVTLPQQRVLFTGDTVVCGRHPYMVTTPNSEAWLETLAAIRHGEYPADLVVPGRGPVCRSAEASQETADYVQEARQRIRTLYREGSPRSDVALLVAEFMARFPIPDEQRDMVQRHVKAGLDRLYEELRPEES